MVNKCVAHGCKTGYSSEKQDHEDHEDHEEHSDTEFGELDGDPSEIIDNGKPGDDNIATFHFPNEVKYPELRAKWIRWVNRKDFTKATNNHVICEKHFDEKFISRGKKCRLKMKMNPVPSIYSAKSLKRPSVLPTPDPPPRKLPKQRGIFEDEMREFNEKDMLHDFSTLGDEHAPVGFMTRKSDDCIVYYRLEFDQKN